MKQEVPPQPVLREAHRGEVERLLRRAVEARARGSAARQTDPAALLRRAQAALEEITAEAAGEYAAYLAALDSRPSSAAGSAARESAATAALLAGVGGVTAFAVDLGHGLSGGAALATGAAVAAAAGVAAGAKAGLRGRPADRGRQEEVQRLRAVWLAALERRGVQPFLERQRAVSPPAAKTSGGKVSPQNRRTDRSAAARRRAVLEQSFGQLPEAAGPFIGRRTHLARISQWVQQARASTETRPTVVMLHGPQGSGRSMLAVRAAHQLRDQFRGTCVVNLRGGSSTEEPLSTREALLHLLNRFGAPREQLLFRERQPVTSPAQHVKRLGEQYQRHLTDLPVVLVLDDAADAEQVRTLIPEHSESLVLVTCAAPLDIGPVAAWTHELPVEALTEQDCGELLRELAGKPDLADDPADSSQSVSLVRELCGGLPLALKIAGSSLGDRTLKGLADDLTASGAASRGASGGDGAAQQALPGGSEEGSATDESAAASRGASGGDGAAQQALPGGSQEGSATDEGGPLDALERALTLRYRDQPEVSRRLLRRLALAGRASLGAAAAAALLATDEAEAARRLADLAETGLLEHVRGSRYRLHDAVRDFAHQRLLDEEEPGERTAAQERLIRTYAELADSVIRLVDGKTSTRADGFVTGAVGSHGFPSLDLALRWLDEESSFITATLRGAEGVDQSAVLHLLGALCDYCLLRGDLYRLGELSELTQAVDQGLLVRSVQWRTGIAARQLGELDRARSTLSSVVNLYFEAQHPAGAARALRDLGITLHHQGNLHEAAARLREALELQNTEELRGDRAWTLHALAAVLRDQGRLGEALPMLLLALELHGESESVHGQAWAHLQLGQTYLRLGEVELGVNELRHAQQEYAATRDSRGSAWTLTQLARARLVGGEVPEAVRELNDALVRHRENEDARGEAWTLYYLGMALEEDGAADEALRSLERARTMFSRMRDVYGLACARHHSARVTRDQRARQVGNLRNSGFARQMLSDARQDFRRIGVPHGEAWSCLELAVIDAGNERIAEALELTEEAVRLFAGIGDRRGEDWARFLRCTLLPLLTEEGARTARADLAALLGADHEARDPELREYAEAWSVVLQRGLTPGEPWEVWRLGMTPNRASRDWLGVSTTP